MGQSLTFRLAFGKVLMDKVPGPFLLDIVVDNPKGNFILTQTAAQVVREAPVLSC